MTKHNPQKAWRERNPLADWAHNATRAATRRGILHKQPCEVCGAENAEAHHPDYLQPLAVVWLCRVHHKALHSLTRGLAKGGDRG